MLTPSLNWNKILFGFFEGKREGGTQAFCASYSYGLLMGFQNMFYYCQA